MLKTIKHFLAGAAFLLIAYDPVRVRAADIPVAPVKSSAPVAWNWSGFYLGGHIGAALNTTDIADPFGAALYGDQVRSPGFIGGGQIGYNYQLGPVVFGFE